MLGIKFDPFQQSTCQQLPADRGAGGSGALDGGGIPSESRVRVSGGKFHTPSGQSGTGAADSRASPPAARPLSASTE